MNYYFTAWEQHLLDQRRLRDRSRELGLVTVGLALIGAGCAGGLTTGWWGWELSELVNELLWIGAITGIGGSVAAWREWGYISLLRKVMIRLSALEYQAAAAVIETTTPDGVSQ